MVKTFVKVHFSIFLNLFLFYSLNLLVVGLFFFFLSLIRSIAIYAERTAERDSRPLFFQFPMVPCTSSLVTCVSHSLLLATEVRNKVPEEKAGRIRNFQ